MNLNHCCDDKCISTVSPLGIEHNDNDKDNVEMDGIQGGGDRGREETDEEAARTRKFLKSVENSNEYKPEVKASEKVSGNRQGHREKVSGSRQGPREGADKDAEDEKDVGAEESDGDEVEPKPEAGK